ncbi:putative amidohydrolase [Roseimicrobium gellanilyticum]|uniref:Putative amidohydrolase n=1 Tax=Roseimicrobium gellanilyticum TaxID=748857 RepID=A0A366HT30_9BACT|nr:carbon-nitrogen hydrolase family protein [Roseimicrobium gellanilyticum]RBP47436.1 putative amidohydrolase [Roseimicrobium gellanilyticum]
MRIAHCQYESWVGDFEHNLKRVEEGLARADREQVEIVSFPECFLSGYPDTEEEARRGAFAMDSPQLAKVLDLTSRFEPTLIVGFNEKRGSDLYNSVVVAHRGHVLGVYSKCAAYQKFHKQGREFPIFERGGVKFGVIICADGGYIEPARILAAKGARIIFAPHFNYIRDTGLISHFMKVRADHTARAIENSVYLVRGNNVVLDTAKSGITRTSGVGYGDSYVIDPGGEILVRSRRHAEDFISIDLEVSKGPDQSFGMSRSAWSFREFGGILEEALRSSK